MPLTTNNHNTSGSVIAQASTSVVIATVGFIISAILIGINIARNNLEPWLLAILITLQTITAIGLIYLFITGKWRKPHPNTQGQGGWRS